MPAVLEEKKKKMKVTTMSCKFLESSKGCVETYKYIYDMKRSPPDLPGLFKIYPVPVKQWNTYFLLFCLLLARWGAPAVWLELVRIR